MTYHVGQMVQLTTSLVGSGTAPTMTLAVTKPDGTTVAPNVVGPTVTANGWSWIANTTADQVGDWLYVFTASGSFVGVDASQFHVIAAGLRIVGLDEVKEHGNITSTASDRELLDFIGTSQQIIEQLVGPTVPTTITGERHRATGTTIWLDRAPVLSVTAVQEYSGTAPLTALIAGEWALDAASGRLDRTTLSGYPSYWLGTEVVVTYRPGRTPIPEAIRWAAKEQTIHLWRSTQAQRGGRARGDTEVTSAAPFGVPNRVRDALAPYLLLPAVA